MPKRSYNAGADLYLSQLELTALDREDPEPKKKTKEEELYLASTYGVYDDDVYSAAEEECTERDVVGKKKYKGEERGGEEVAESVEMDEDSPVRLYDGKENQKNMCGGEGGMKQKSTVGRYIGESGDESLVLEKGRSTCAQEAGERERVSNETLVDLKFSPVKRDALRVKSPLGGDADESDTQSGTESVETTLGSDDERVLEDLEDRELGWEKKDFEEQSECGNEKKSAREEKCDESVGKRGERSVDLFGGSSRMKASSRSGLPKRGLAQAKEKAFKVLGSIEEELAEETSNGSYNESGAFSNSAKNREQRPKIAAPANGDEVPLVLDEETSVRPGLNKYLRKYQKEGVQFLFKNYKRGVGSLLADEMGLGKTLQVVALFSAIMKKTGCPSRGSIPTFLLSDSQKLARENSKKRMITLIICPSSLIYNWDRELQTWDYFDLGIYHGSEKEKISTLELAEDGKIDAVITSYDTARSGVISLKQINWDIVVFDESHKLKNSATKTYIALKELVCTSPGKYRPTIALTGTPIQNNLDEFFNLLNFINPGCLGSAERFHNQFTLPMEKALEFSCNRRSVVVGKTMRDKFKALYQQWVIGRKKSILKDQLPRKRDRVIFCPMTSQQEDVYCRLLESPLVRAYRDGVFECLCCSGRSPEYCCFDEVDNEGRPVGLYEYDREKRRLLMCYISALIKVCNHWLLLAPRPTDTDKKKANDEIIAKNVLFEKERRMLKQAVMLADTSCTGKLKVLEDLLRVFKDERAKVLVFSQSTRVLDVIEDRIAFNGWEYCRLDGKTKLSDRIPMVDEFSNNSQKFVFLISTRAGGVGLNITAANRVIIYDPSWNPAHDLQAQDRAYRIGQVKDVDVYRLLCSKTIEENIYNRQIFKQQVSNRTLDGANTKRLFDREELFTVKNLFARPDEGVFTKIAVERKKVIDTRFERLGTKDSRAKFEFAEYENTIAKYAGAETKKDTSDDPDDDYGVEGVVESLGLNFAFGHEELVNQCPVEEKMVAAAILAADDSQYAGCTQDFANAILTRPEYDCGEESDDIYDDDDDDDIDKSHTYSGADSVSDRKSQIASEQAESQPSSQSAIDKKEETFWSRN
eukprot:Nk52_evm23s252 gene=Nk52_evmTU23s252